MPDLLVHPASKPLRGSVSLPADKSIVHRGLLLGALADGASELLATAVGADNRATLAALRALGVEVEEQRDRLRIHGVGLAGLRAPTAPIDCGNSGTTMRLLAGLLAAQPFASTLVGDASLSGRPMERVVVPLRLRGARIEGALRPDRPGRVTAPLELGPLPEPAVLSSLEFDLPVPSAQVKSALLLSGLYADGATALREPLVSRDHTERMLQALGVPLRTVGAFVELDALAWDGRLPAFGLRPPGDLSAAAFVLVAGALVAGSEVEARGVGLNPTRTGLLELLRDMGATLELEPLGDELGEPLGRVRLACGPLVGARLGGELALRAIDELPLACALGARAHGTTTLCDAAELRVKETDRIAATVALLRAFGVEVEERPDGLALGGRPEGALRACDVDSRGDHRIAMTAAVLALVADGPCRVRDAGCIATSFPRFVGTLRALGAQLEVV